MGYLFLHNQIWVFFYLAVGCAVEVCVIEVYCTFGVTVLDLSTHAKNIHFVTRKVK